MLPENADNGESPPAVDAGFFIQAVKDIRQSERRTDAVRIGVVGDDNGDLAFVCQQFS